MTYGYNANKRRPTARVRESMMRTMYFTALIEKEGDGFVALCPELDIASQGSSVEEARSMLQEAVGLFFECASGEEIGHRAAARN
jgi:predicted RNase H-like HicB family nuclease